MSEIKRFGIDVSHWQGDFDFARAKSKEGVEFAILKAGGGDAGLYKDSKFEANYKKCEVCGLPKGAYFYGNAKSTAEAKKEAEYFISILKGKRYEYPVFYDVEGKMITDNDRATLTEIVKAFCSTMESAGYWVGIYSSESFFNSEMNDGELTRYSHWVARWGKSKPAPTSGAETQMWQFGGETNLIRSNKINGQTCDQDYCYVDYPAKIKAAGLNGYGKSEENTVPENENAYDFPNVPFLVKVIIDNLNYRSEPCMGNNVKGQTGIGTFTIVAVRDGWGRLKSGAGWIWLKNPAYCTVYGEVSEEAPAKFTKTVDEMAREVIKGVWGNGEERKERLTAAGYDYAVIQRRVNELLS